MTGLGVHKLRGYRATVAAAVVVLVSAGGCGPDAERGSNRFDFARLDSIENAVSAPEFGSLESALVENRYQRRYTSEVDEWLRDPSVLEIDEEQLRTDPEYREALEQLGSLVEGYRENGWMWTDTVEVAMDQLASVSIRYRTDTDEVEVSVECEEDSFTGEGAPCVSRRFFEYALELNFDTDLTWRVGAEEGQRLTADMARHVVEQMVELWQLAAPQASCVFTRANGGRFYYLLEETSVPCDEVVGTS